MNLRLNLEDKLKNKLKSINARALVDKQIGGELLDVLKRAYSNIEFIHVGETEVSDAMDDTVVEYAMREGYDIIVTMDYGMARKALLKDLAVILVFEAEQHRYYLITYPVKLGTVRFRVESTL